MSFQWTNGVLQVKLCMCSVFWWSFFFRDVAGEQQYRLCPQVLGGVSAVQAFCRLVGIHPPCLGEGHLPVPHVLWGFSLLFCIFPPALSTQQPFLQEALCSAMWVWVALSGLNSELKGRWCLVFTCGFYNAVLCCFFQTSLPFWKHAVAHGDPVTHPVKQQHIEINKD